MRSPVPWIKEQLLTGVGEISHHLNGIHKGTRGDLGDASHHEELHTLLPCCSVPDGATLLLGATRREQLGRR
jgi:hypothetical protein